MKNLLNILGAFLIVLLVWQLIIVLGGVNEALFPSPYRMLAGFGELIADGTLFRDIGASLYRLASAYLSSVFIAIILGLILGWYSRIWAFISPIVQLLRPISPMAWTPFIVLFFGIGDMPAIIIIFIAAFFPVLLATVAAVREIDPIYIKVAQNFAVTNLQTLIKIVLPAAFPRIATGLHLALGTAWVFLVAGEMAGSQSGLGFLIIDSRNNFRNDLVMSAILTIGVLGLLLDAGISFVERLIKRRWGINRIE